MRNDARAHDKGTSLAKGPAWFIGLASLALGILGMIFGSSDFGSDPMSGTVDGSSFLGIEGNGWTWALFAAGGLLLLLAAPMHWGAKTMALVVGLAFGAASIISMVDGNDVFGTIATNGLTQLVLGAAAAALLITALLPRVNKKDKTRTEHVEPAPRRERVVERETVGRVHEPPVETQTVGRVHEPQHDEVIDRHRVTDRDRDGIDDRSERFDRADRVERTGRFDRDQGVERETVEHTPVGVQQGEQRLQGDDRYPPSKQDIEPGHGRVVAPADGDGIEDRGRRRS